MASYAPIAANSMLDEEHPLLNRYLDDDIIDLTNPEIENRISSLFNQYHMSDHLDCDDEMIDSVTHDIGDLGSALFDECEYPSSNHNEWQRDYKSVVMQLC